MEYLGQNAEGHRPLIEFITGLATNGAYKIEAELTNKKQQRRYKWAESTLAMLGELKLQKGAAAIRVLHDSVYTPELTTVRRFLKTNKVVFDMWNAGANIDVAVQLHQARLTALKLTGTSYAHGVELSGDETGILNTRCAETLPSPGPPPAQRPCAGLASPVDASLVHNRWHGHWRGLVLSLPGQVLRPDDRLNHPDLPVPQLRHWLRR